MNEVLRYTGEIIGAIIFSIILLVIIGHGLVSQGVISEEWYPSWWDEDEPELYLVDFAYHGRVYVALCESSAIKNLEHGTIVFEKRPFVEDGFWVDQGDMEGLAWRYKWKAQMEMVEIPPLMIWYVSNRDEPLLDGNLDFDMRILNIRLEEIPVQSVDETIRAIKYNPFKSNGVITSKEIPEFYV